jgi:hypothetical protein
MATTSPDNLWTPDTGDDFALTVDLAAFADTVQDALTDIRTEIQYTSGTDAARITAAATASIGDRWVTTDTTPKQEFFYTGSAWVLDYVPRTSWTPTWTNFIVGASTVTANYCVTAGRCIGSIDVAIGSGFAMSSSTINFIPPITPAVTTSNRVLGNAIYVNSGIGYYHGPLMSTGANIALFADVGGFISGINGVGVPYSWNSGDGISVLFNFPV